MKHIVVYKESDRYAGWPANHGIWSWGDYIVVGFSLGYLNRFNYLARAHPIDERRPQVPMLAKTDNGGETWKIERPSFITVDDTEPEPRTFSGGIDFLSPEFALWVRMGARQKGFSWFYWSSDYCATWNGPYHLPTFDRKGVFGRTDYLVHSDRKLTLLLTSAKDDGKEGWPFVAETTDGCVSWRLQSWIGPQPERGAFAIMPSTVCLPEGDWLTFIRRMDAKAKWIEPWRSRDGGDTWELESHNAIDTGGNSAHLIRLDDGRLVVTYGYRKEPCGIRAKVSGDGGRTWGNEIILRDDGAGWDLGYPRTAQRVDSKLVTVYYFWDSQQVERYIAATIWEAN